MKNGHLYWLYLPVTDPSHILSALKLLLLFQPLWIIRIQLILCAGCGRISWEIRGCGEEDTQQMLKSLLDMKLVAQWAKTQRESCNTKFQFKTGQRLCPHVSCWSLLENLQ